PAARHALETRELAQDLLADLIAAGADPGPDRSRLGLDRACRLGDYPAGEAAPAAVDHGNPVRPYERERKAVSDHHQRSELGIGGGVGVDLGRAADDIGVDARLLPLVVARESRSMDLAAHHDSVAGTIERGS